MAPTASTARFLESTIPVPADDAALRSLELARVHQQLQNVSLRPGAGVGAEHADVDAGRAASADPIELDRWRADLLVRWEAADEVGERADVVLVDEHVVVGAARGIAPVAPPEPEDVEATTTGERVDVERLVAGAELQPVVAIGVGPGPPPVLLRPFVARRVDPRDALAGGVVDEFVELTRAIAGPVVG